MLSVNFKGKILLSSFFTLHLLKKGFAPRTYIIRTRVKNPYNLNTYKKNYLFNVSLFFATKALIFSTEN